MMAGDAVKVGGRVDIVGAPGVAALDERDQVRAGAQERPGTLVAGRRRDDLGPVLAGQEHRVARLAIVGSDRHGGASPVRGDQARDRLLAHQWLVGQRDHHGVHVRGKSSQGDTKRGSHAGAPLWIVYCMYSDQLHRGSAGDDEDRVRTTCYERIDTALGKGLPVQFDQRLRLPEARALPRGQQYPGN
jgi:hypothetical protein